MQQSRETKVQPSPSMQQSRDMKSAWQRYLDAKWNPTTTCLGIPIGSQIQMLYHLQLVKEMLERILSSWKKQNLSFGFLCMLGAGQVC